MPSIDKKNAVLFFILFLFPPMNYHHFSTCPHELPPFFNMPPCKTTRDPLTDGRGKMVVFGR